jgi:HAD superfamily hydrolase (TIGR01509 family)
VSHTSQVLHADLIIPPMAQPTFRNAIWDFDGTLFDTYPAICRAFQQALADFDAFAPLAEIESLCRVEVSHCATELAVRFELDANEFFRAFGKHYVATPFADQPPFPGAREVCERILAIGGVNAIVTHRNAETAARLLALHGMSSLFVQVITRDDGYPRKPDPAAFFAVLQHQGLDPAETLAIGDRELDILAGRAAGLSTCLYRGASSSVAADLSVSDFAQLLDVLLISS